MKCSFCGWEIEGNAKFCPNCGSKLEQPLMQYDSPEEVTNVPEESNEIPEEPVETPSEVPPVPTLVPPIPPLISDEIPKPEDTGFGYTYGGYSQSNDAPTDDAPSGGTSSGSIPYGSTPSGNIYEDPNGPVNSGPQNTGYGPQGPKPNYGPSSSGPQGSAPNYGTGGSANYGGPTPNYGQPNYGSAGQMISGTPYLVFSILVTICCCLPLGVVGIVYAAKIGSLQAAGDYEGALRASKMARNFTIAGAVIGLLFSIGTAALSVGGFMSDPDFMQEIQEYQNMNEIFPESEEEAPEQESMAPVEEEQSEEAQSEETTETESEEAEAASEDAASSAVGSSSSAPAGVWNSFSLNIGKKGVMLPCAISDVEASGLKMDDYDITAETEIEAGKTQFVVFSNDKGSVMFSICNPGDAPQKASECKVSGIYVSDYDLENLGIEIVFPGGITVGDEIDDVTEKWGSYSDVYNGEYSDIYTWSDETTYDSCTVTVDKQSGKVTGIDLDKVL